MPDINDLSRILNAKEEGRDIAEDYIERTILNALIEIKLWIARHDG